MKKVLLCYGNEFLEQDSLAKKLADGLTLEGFEIVQCNEPDEVLSYPKDTQLSILDAVKGLERVTKLKSSDLKAKGITTLHDFDLSQFLQLLEATKQLPELSIIGIPMQGDKEKIKKEVVRILKSN